MVYLKKTKKLKYYTIWILYDSCYNLYNLNRSDNKANAKLHVMMKMDDGM